MNVFHTCHKLVNIHLLRAQTTHFLIEIDGKNNIIIYQYSHSEQLPVTPTSVNLSKYYISRIAYFFFAEATASKVSCCFFHAEIVKDTSKYEVLLNSVTYILRSN